MTELEVARRNSGKPAREIAAELNITVQTWYNYEKNPDMMPVGRARRACQVMGCKFENVFGC